MIPQQDLERIASANDIVDLVNGYFPLKRAGAVYKALCPFHQEKSPSFTVNPARQSFKCFGCGAGGQVFKFVELYENVSFPEAVKRLAARRGIALSDEPMSEEENARQRKVKRLLGLHAAAAEWFHKQLLRNKAAQHARDYLKSRGYTAEVAKSWKLGYAPESWDAFYHFALQEGYRDDELLESGLLTKKEGSNRLFDRFRDRLMIPICDDIGQGQVIAFSGRVLNPEAKGAKYVNSPETPLFTKGKVLFGLQKSKRAIIDKKAAILCEGQIDTISSYEAGATHIVASQGTAFTKQHANKLRQLTGSGEVILCFDSDSAGNKAADKAAELLLEVGLTLRRVVIPPGEDPDSFIRAHGPEAFLQLIAQSQDFFLHAITHFTTTPEFHTPRGRTDFSKKMAGFVALITDVVLRETMIHNVSAQLEISAEQFASLLKKAKETPQWRDEPVVDESYASSEPPPSPLVPLTFTMRLLTQFSMLNPEVHRWLLGQPWEPLVGAFQDGELLTKILRAPHFSPGDPGSLAAFLAILPAQEQNMLTELLDIQELPTEALQIVNDCWRDLERKHLEQQRDTFTARLRKPGLDVEEVIVLQKQVLDLTQRLTHITRPLSAPS